MMKILLLIILSLTYAIADECDPLTILEGQTITDIAETNCLNEEKDKKYLDRKLTKSKQTKTFCKTCNNHLLKLSLKDTKSNPNKDNEYAQATLNELQKELTLVSIDLMKTRSSFSLNFNPASAVKSCNFKNLPPPRCLLKESNKKKLDFFNAEKDNIQSTLATEYANILSSEPNKESALLARTIENSCKIKDSDVLFAQMRFSESLLTSDLISQLKSLKLKPGSKLLDAFKDNMDDEKKKLYDSILVLSGHPLIKSIIEDPESLNSFLNEINTSEKNESIIEKLYSSTNSQNFGQVISARCDRAFQETSKILEKVYCNEGSPYVAQDAKVMSLINGAPFTELPDTAAEKAIQIHCAIYNNSIEENSKSTNFNEIFEINSRNDATIAYHPIEKFKVEAYGTSIGNDAIAICNAKKGTPKCETQSTLRQCQLLSFLNLSKKSKDYKGLADTSDKNINEILKSLVGKGLPLKDGKTDTAAVAFLQSEGILPGGNQPSPQSAPRDAGSFHRAVANSNNNSMKPATSQAAKVPAPVSPTQAAPTSPVTSSLSDEEEYDSQSDSQSETSKNKTESNKTNNSFSALSDEEQTNLLNRMKPKSKGKKSARTSKSESSGDSDESYSRPGQDFSPGTFTTDQAAAVADNTAVDKPTISQGDAHSGTRAKLDPKKIDKDASFNEAKIQASQNRTPASDITKDTIISLSKTDGGLNKIEIKVPDESVLGKKTPELESKIQDYLDKSGQSLQGAKKGEAFIVKLGKYDIKVSINDYGVYVATCKDKSIHPDYLAFLSRYFTGIKERVSSSEAMKKVLIESTSSK